MKHGEYKTPGGKLVIVDFTVADGRLSNVQINGDFFLEPPETLELLNAALEGADAAASAEQLAQLVEQSVPEEAQLIGFDPAGIATAVRRALE